MRNKVIEKIDPVKFFKGIVDSFDSKKIFIPPYDAKQIFVDLKKNAREFSKKFSEAPIEEQLYFYQQHKEMLEKKITSLLKPKDILDCFASKQNFLNWNACATYYKQQVKKIDRDYRNWFKSINFMETKKNDSLNAFKDYGALSFHNTFELLEKDFPQRIKYLSVDLSGLNLSHELKFAKASPLHGVVAWMILDKCNLSNTILHNVSFERCFCYKVNFKNAKFGGLEKFKEYELNHVFEKKRIDRPNFWHGQCISCDLTNVDLQYAYLRDANFSQSILTNASLRHANCFEANFSDCDLTGANFSNADVRAANFTGAIINKTNFRKAMLTGAVGLDLKKLS